MQTKTVQKQEKKQQNATNKQLSHRKQANFKTINDITKSTL